ncbi:MAG: FkbM family methyltransferase [Polyangiaceae bacterium]|nr:FkbM family methyltransferase [Polyangiaceae bacterium]
MSRKLHALLNRVLPRPVREVLRRRALQVIPSMRHLDMPTRLAHARDLGLSPAVIFDVGAASGEWARMAAAVWPQASIIGFEPNVSCVPDLERTRTRLQNFRYYRCFLGASRSTVGYADRGTQTSLFDPGAQGATETAPMLVLDEMVRDGVIPSADLIKLDVQGYELEVLRGAIGVLARCTAVILEVSFYPLGPGAPLVEDVLEFMRQQGFVWYDVVGIYRRPSDDALGQMDLLFLRAGHTLLHGGLL